MKGIVLAGGAGTRLHPLTMVASKQLQPVYDKPMIYYPLSTLMLGGLRDLLLISTPNDVPRFEALLGDGSQWGVSLSYAVQTAPRGIADSLLVGEKFLDGDSVSLVLGDNIFYGRIGFDDIVRDFRRGAVIFGYPVQDPQRYGIVEFGDNGEVRSLEEKPGHPRSNLAVPGIYVYDGDAVGIVKDLQPSPRGELEITDLNLEYHRRGELRAVRLGRGVAWLDSGTHESLLESANFIATIERRQGLKIACLEEVAYRQGFIDAEGLEAAAADMPPSPYRTYVLSLLDDEVASGL
jgi:glucose-1-phosphate thymidylyltransferase